MTQALIFAALHTLGRRAKDSSKRLARAAASAGGPLTRFAVVLPFLAASALLFIATPMLLGLAVTGNAPSFMRDAHGLSPRPFLAWLAIMATADAMIIALAAAEGEYSAARRLGEGRIASTLMAPWKHVGKRLNSLFDTVSHGRMLGREGTLMATLDAAPKLALACLGAPLLVALFALFGSAQRIARWAGAALQFMNPKNWKPTLARLAQESPEILARQEAKKLGGSVGPASHGAIERSRL